MWTALNNLVKNWTSFLDYYGYRPKETSDKFYQSNPSSYFQGTFLNVILATEVDQESSYSPSFWGFFALSEREDG